MEKVVIVAVLIIVLVILIDFVRLCSANHRYRAAENRRYQRFLREKATLRRDAMEAYRKMLREACREGGFWENTDTNGADEAEDY